MTRKVSAKPLKPRFKYFGVEITRPIGRVRLSIPPKNWTKRHDAVMRKLERALVEMFKLERGAHPNE